MKKHSLQTVTKWVTNEFTDNLFKKDMKLQLSANITYDFMKYYDGKATSKHFKSLSDYTKYFITNSTDKGMGHVMFCMQAAEFYCELNKIRL